MNVSGGARSWGLSGSGGRENRPEKCPAPPVSPCHSMSSDGIPAAIKPSFAIPAAARGSQLAPSSASSPSQVGCIKCKISRGDDGNARCRPQRIDRGWSAGLDSVGDLQVAGGPPACRATRRSPGRRQPAEGARRGASSATCAGYSTDTRDRGMAGWLVSLSRWGRDEGTWSWRRRGGQRTKKGVGHKAILWVPVQGLHSTPEIWACPGRLGQVAGCSGV